MVFKKMKKLAKKGMKKKKGLAAMMKGGMKKPSGFQSEAGV